MHISRIQLEVEAIVRARGTLDAAEDLINNIPGLSDDQRAALWLIGWSLLPAARQRSEALAHLQAVTEVTG